jgi:hypothetical protein
MSHTVIASIGKNVSGETYFNHALPMPVTNMMSRVRWFLGKFASIQCLLTHMLMISSKRHADFNYKWISKHMKWQIQSPFEQELKTMERTKV